MILLPIFDCQAHLLDICQHSEQLRTLFIESLKQTGQLDTFYWGQKLIFEMVHTRHVEMCEHVQKV